MAALARQMLARQGMDDSLRHVSPQAPQCKAQRPWLRGIANNPAWLISLTLAAITIGLYAPVLNFDFVVFDDEHYVKLNPMVQRGLTLEGIWWAFSGFHLANWHPLTFLSHMLDCSLFGLWAGAHHFTNARFHAAKTVLVFLLLRRLTGALWRPALVAALFAWHPLHVESVAWLSERKDVLSTLFLLLTIWAYARYAEKPGVGRYLAVTLWFGLGLMAKPMLVTVPCMMLLLDFWPLGRTRFWAPPSTEKARRGREIWLLVEKLPFFAMAMGAGVLTVLAQQTWDAVSSLQVTPLSSRLCNATISYAEYLSKMLWPANLCIYYPLARTIPWWLPCASFLLLVGISLLVWRLRSGRPWLGMGWLWYLVTLLPVIGLVQVGGQAMADRYTYVPLLGIFIMIVWSLAPLVEAWNARPRLKIAVVGSVLLCCLACSSGQLQYWRDSVSLFAHCTEVTENNWMAHHDLGAGLLARGDNEDAVPQFEESLRIRPGNPLSHMCLGMALSGLGHTSEAISHYREAQRLKPSDPLNPINLGALLAEQGQVSEAIEEFMAALKVAPLDCNARLNLAQAIKNQGHTPEALIQYRTTVHLAPTWPDALNRLALVLATHSDARFRDGVSAVGLAEKANQLTHQTNVVVLNTLAAAYAEAGRFDEAIAAQQHALDLALASGRKGLKPQIENALQLFKLHKPYHEGD